MSHLRIAVGALVVGATLLLTSNGVQVNNEDRDELESRVEKLESRVKKLESILFATSKLSELEAQEEFDRARAVLKESENLHMRGFITLAELQEDRFRVEQAERELALALTDNRQRQIVGEIDLLQAKRDLEMAQESLDHTQRLFDRGFVSEREMQNMRRNVLQFQRRLELAKNKAAAASDLSESDNQDKQEELENLDAKQTDADKDK